MKIRDPIMAMADLPTPEPATVFDVAIGLDHDAVVECLRVRGFCILRGLFTEQLMDHVNERAELYLSKPSIAGAAGYWKKDYQKKIVNSFTLGGPTLDVLLDERVIDIAEKSIGGECILSETILKFDRSTPYIYFPLHADFAEGWRKSQKSVRELNADDLHKVLGIGGTVYLHDTTEGAFTYCDGTHSIMAPNGQILELYSKADQSVIRSRKVRCDGKKGDVVLFDDRGFHGPSQPSKKDRTVILLDYYSVEVIGRLQASPMPIWSTDIARMSPKQSRVAGVGANFMVDPIEYTHAGFRRSINYRVLSFIVSRAFFYRHFKLLLKRWLFG